MDKYEYRLKLDEIKETVSGGEYEQAAKLADNVNWNKVKNANTLCMIGSVYKKVSRTKDAQEIYKLAYKRSPGSKNALYYLCELSLKLGETQEAEDYYNEFITIAPKDQMRYVLGYRIACVKDRPLQERIELLEELKRREYIEEWAYELAYLYYQADQADSCINACDELALWFGDGEYVRKALELKTHFQPLTHAQQDQYERITHGRSDRGQDPIGRIMRGEPADAGHETDIQGRKDERRSAPAAEGKEGDQEQPVRVVAFDPDFFSKKAIQPDDGEKPVREVAFTPGLTAADKEAPAGSAASDDWSDDDWSDMEETDKAQPADDIAAGKLSEVKEAGEAQAVDDIAAAELSVRAKADEVQAADEAADAILMQALSDELSAEETLPDEEPEAVQSANEPVQAAAEEKEQQEPVQTAAEEKEQQEPAEAAAEEKEQQKPAEAVASKPSEELVQADIEEQSEAAETIVSESFEEPLETDSHPETVIAPAAAQMRSSLEQIREGLDALLASAALLADTAAYGSLADRMQEAAQSMENAVLTLEKDLKGPDADAAQPVEEGKPYKDAAADPETIAPAKEAVADTETIEPAEESAEAAETIEPAKESVQEYTEDFREESGKPDILSQIDVERVGAEELAAEPDADIFDTGSLADFGSFDLSDFGDDEQDMPMRRELFGEPEEEEKVQELSAGISGQETAKEEDMPAAIEDTPAAVEDTPAAIEDAIEDMPAAIEDMPAAIEDMPAQEDMFDEEEDMLDAEEDMLDEEEDMLDEEEPDGEGSAGIQNKPAAASAVLSEAQRAYFSYFLPVPGMEVQICDAVDGICRQTRGAQTSMTGNAVIIGEEGSGKTVLATSLIKVIQQNLGKSGAKIGKISAASLNRRDFAGLLPKIAGGYLIIEHAGELSRETAIRMSQIMEQNTQGLLIIMEDNAVGIRKALDQDYSFGRKFTHRIRIPIFTIDELVSFGRSYAQEKNCVIDEMGILALYNRINNIQKLDHVTTLTEVKQIMDEAIENARSNTRRMFGSLFSKKADAGDVLTLQEGDFDV